jgi:hypothetical protein
MSSTIAPTDNGFDAANTTISPPPKCTTAVPDHFGHVPPDACNANYGFYPSWENNMAVAIAFAATTFVHIVQAFVLKKVCFIYGS